MATEQMRAIVVNLPEPEMDRLLKIAKAQGLTAHAYATKVVRAAVGR
ncbi:hypothetical protein [Tsukamurella soli]|uniref:Uncharacterized protein n=1 Tax=Tsukamurella soli TaxID=644556 RepID=A0ABP8JIU7_9ACTN